MKEFLNVKSATYTCKEQELLVKNILLKVLYILGILATSKGKSLSYLLTVSLATSKVTIVIVPLVGLKQDLLERAKGFNIPCTIYKQSRSFSNLTLISTETIVQDLEFISSLKVLQTKQRLDRIVFNKYYLIIIAKIYKSVMYRLRELVAFKTQVVFLSRTVPLYIEQALQEEFKFVKLTTIRGITMRENIAYKARQYKSL